MNEIIKHIEGQKLILKLSKKIYCINAITNTSYKFTENCYILIQPIDEDEIEVSFSPKGNSLNELEDTVNNFCNELIDQQVRINIEKEFANVRDAIVKKAFSSISE